MCRVRRNELQIARHLGKPDRILISNGSTYCFNFQNDKLSHCSRCLNPNHTRQELQSVSVVQPVARKAIKMSSVSSPGSTRRFSRRLNDVKLSDIAGQERFGRDILQVNLKEGDSIPSRMAREEYICGKASTELHMLFCGGLEALHFISCDRLRRFG